MQTSFEIWAGAVLPHFKFRVLGLCQAPSRQNEWIFESDQGKKHVRIYQDESEFRNDFEVSEYVARHGYRRIPRLIRTKYGDAGILFDQAWYGFTDVIEGRVLQFSPEDVLPFIRNMALIHRAIQNLPLRDSASDVKTWRELMLTSVQDVKQSLEFFEKSPARDTFQSFVFQHVNWYINHARRVGQVFGEDPNSTGSRCLGNIRIEDCILGHNGNVYLTTIPKPYADTPIYDVAKFCLYALDQGHPDAIPDILKEYRTISNITDQELEQIKTYLVFPHSNWKLFYMYKRKRGMPDQIAKLMQQEQEKNKEREAWIHSLFPVSK